MRHGETTWNLDGRIQGHSDDATLTDRGVRQAQAAAETLRGDVFDAIISSDLGRARETATIIARGRGLEVITTPALRERAYGPYEGRPTGDLPVTLAGYDGESVLDADARPAGGESLNDLYERAGQWLASVRRDYAGQRVLVVTHGGTLRAIRAACSATPIASTRWYPVDNASVWTTDLNGDPLT